MHFNKAKPLVAKIFYGTNSEIALDLPAGAIVADCRAAKSADIPALELAQRAIATLLDFPPLRRAVVPGDHIILALSPGVPQAADVVAAIVPELIAGGAAPADVTVVCAPGEGDDSAALQQHDPRRGLPEELRQAVQLAVHHPATEGEVSYLAANAQGEPIYLNRQMCDADLVLPIGCLLPDHSASKNGRGGIWNETLFPTFSDRNTIEHFAPNGVAVSPGQQAHRQRQIDDVAWRMGVQITVQVVPGSGNRAMHVLAGAPESVFRHGRASSQAAWRFEVPGRASLVIAGLSGDAMQQTWQNLGRALEAALAVVAEEGAIALCTDLATKPGPALRVLAAAADAEEAQSRLRKLHSADAPLARLLLDALDRSTVYLLSRLDEELVSPLGFAPVADAAEIARLATHHASCILLPDAQFARPFVAE